MDRTFRALFRTLREARLRTPDDLGAALAALPPVHALPLPWETWALFALAGYRRRKLWAHALLESRLAPHWGRRGGTPPLEEATARGFVPGLPEWEYDLDGEDTDLAHRVTGEHIHLDLVNGPEVMRRSGFAQYLLHRRRPGEADRRLLEFYPHRQPLWMVFDDLVDAGVLRRFDETDVELCDAVREHAGAIAAFCSAWREPAARLWLAALVNDWPAARAAARARADPALVALTGPRARRCRRRRLADLRGRVEHSGLSDELLYALADAGADDLPRYVRHALARRGGGATAALRLVADDPAFIPEVAALFGLSLERDGPLDYLRVDCAAYLARHGHHPRRVIERLAASHGRDSAQAVLLALEHDPGLAPPLLRRALRSGDAHHRLTAAAALALIDRPWSRRELIAALEAAHDPGMTAECRAALRESRDPAARRAAAAWGADEAGPATDRAPFPGDEEVERALSGLMEELRARIGAARDRFPPP
jgi:hypothetical protein